MLTQLSVRNFTLVKSLDIEFANGMTAITGETGAGKSILLNALGLTLGDRADYGQIRNGETRADVHAIFDISKNNEICEFLEQQELNDAETECILRRTINTSGSSKAWINGQPVNLSVLRQVAQRLIDIHSQHEHQKLVQSDHQLKILDAYAAQLNSNHLDLAADTGSAFARWHHEKTRLTEIEENLEAAHERRDLLQFQVTELEELALQKNEYIALEQEQNQLANAETILTSMHELSQRLSGDEEFNLLSAVNEAVIVAESISAPVSEMESAREMLASASIQIEEAHDSVRRAQNSVAIDPERLAIVESRLSRAFELARKHRVAPEELPALQEKLTNELAGLDQGVGDIDGLREEVQNLEQRYNAVAKDLHQSRQSAARKLGQEVNAYLEQLNMAGAELRVELEETKPNAAGGSTAQFQIKTNPGSPEKPIGKIASGGELSRISLAIQVVTAQTSRQSTLIFDEVDVGIGGATATIVGDLLRKLGDHAQVVCVTHLAQVASKAHQQMAVSKSITDDETETSIHPLDEDARIAEIARMVSGAKQSDQTLAHAKELLEN